MYTLYIIEYVYIYFFFLEAFKTILPYYKSSYIVIYSALSPSSPSLSHFLMWHLGNLFLYHSPSVTLAYPVSFLLLGFPWSALDVTEFCLQHLWPSHSNNVFLR